MPGGGPLAIAEDFTGLSLEQRLALLEQQMITLLGVLHRLREELDE